MDQIVSKYGDVQVLCFIYFIVYSKYTKLVGQKCILFVLEPFEYYLRLQTVSCIARFSCILRL